MPTQSPSAILTDSLAAFSQAAYKAFAEIEAQMKVEVARAISDAREAQSARDEALDLFHSSQLEGKSFKQELLACRASLKQAEMKIAHQADLISQLRREAAQWKDQSNNWQDHFLRVEQERCALVTRCDELLAQRLHKPTAHDVSSHALDASQSREYIGSSTTAKRGPPSKNPPAYTPKDVLINTSSTTQRSASKSTKEPSKSAKASKGATKPAKPLLWRESPEPPAAAPKPPALKPTVQVIRRVQAIVHVKEESDDDDYQLPSTPPSEDDVLHVPKRRKSQTSARKAPKRSIVDNDNEATEQEATQNLSDDDEYDELMLGVGAENEHSNDHIPRKRHISTKAVEPPPLPMVSPKKRRQSTSQRNGREIRRKI